MNTHDFEFTFGASKELNAIQSEHLAKLRESYNIAAEALSKYCPANPDKGKALDFLRDSMIAAESSIRFRRNILDSKTLCNLFPQEKQDVKIARVWLCMSDYYELRNSCHWGMEFTSKRALIGQGFLAKIHDIEIWVSNLVSKGFMKVVPSVDGAALSSDFFEDQTPLVPIYG